MKIQFWGVRGSLPVPGPDTVRFGGNTPCTTVDVPGQPTLVLDAGTGIRCLGRELAAQAGCCEIYLILSHGHWDHVQGFPFFAPAYVPESRILVLGNRGTNGGPSKLLNDVMADSHFPVPLVGLNAQLQFRDLNDGWNQVGSLEILAVPTEHPGGGYGYRVRWGEQSVVYLTDNELPADGQHPRFLEAAQGADVLIHDAQYCEAEMETYRGWGHSSVESVVRLACSAGVKDLFLFHHDPDRTDSEIEQFEKLGQELARSLKSPLRVRAAAEKMRFEITSAGLKDLSD